MIFAAIAEEKWRSVGPALTPTEDIWRCKTVTWNNSPVM